MSLADDKRLLNTVLTTPLHGRVTVRWEPGSWRMHVPLVRLETLKSYEGSGEDDSIQALLAERWAPASNERRRCVLLAVGYLRQQPT